MAPLKGRKLNGRSSISYFIHPPSVAYFILASKIEDGLFFDKWHTVIPEGTTGVLARTQNDGPLRVTGVTSVRSISGELEGLWDFVEISPGITANLDFIVGVPDVQGKRRIVLVRVGGEIEGLAMSKHGATRLAKAMRRRYEGKPLPSPEHPPAG